jgi:asparagine synthetase B (glutamine-hydrolysing)
MVHFGGSLLLSNVNQFTVTERTGTSVSILMRRPKIDHQGLSGFQWNLDRQTIHMNRDWVGIFPIRYSRKAPLIVTSHNKLAALSLKRPVCLQTLEAGSSATAEFRSQRPLDVQKPTKPFSGFTYSYKETVSRVRHGVIRSVQRNLVQDAALLLSGGLDSTIIAAVANQLGLRLRTFTFAMSHPPSAERGLLSDRICAEEAATIFGHLHHTIQISTDRLRANIPAAVYLGETARGTIVDELAAHIEMARFFKSQNIRHVLTGEGADDLFGAFPFALRYHRGRQLTAFLQKELMQGLPDELAVLQAVYSPWGVSLVYPYWTEELCSLGYNLPLHYRVDRKRLMKRVLRDAFADLLPPRLLMRPKGVPRDCTQIREVLESAFGNAPGRYRSILSKMMRGRSQWPDELLRTLRNK